MNARLNSGYVPNRFVNRFYNLLIKSKMQKKKPIKHNLLRYETFKLRVNSKNSM